MSSQHLISRIYEAHPLSADSILRRVALTQPGKQKVCESDLAYDPIYGITDQNHLGGAPFVLAMGQRLGLQNGRRVLDLGSGLGGPARLLAETFAVQVVGVDLSAQRSRDAQLLTQLAQVTGVRFLQGDFRNVPVDAGTADVLWGQGTWSHIADRTGFLQRWLPALQPRGKVACEDVYLLSEPSIAEQEKALGELKEIWQVQLCGASQWLSAFAEAGLEVLLFEDLSCDMQRYCAEFANLTHKWPDWPPLERVALERAAALATQSILGYFRIIAEIS